MTVTAETNHDCVRLGIIVKCWPRLSETFIAQELAGLEANGITFDIWSMRYPANDKKHPLHDAVKAKIHYLPEYLHREPLRVLQCWWRIRKQPNYPNARRIWWQDYKRDLSRNRIRRFGQALVMAHELDSSVHALYAHFLHTPSSVARYTAIIHGLKWGFSAHAKDIWTSPDWEIHEKLDPENHGADFGVTCTASGLNQLQQFETRSDTVSLAYHGLDLTRFPQPPDRQLEKNEKFQILSVGRLVEKKGFDRLLKALALLPNTLQWHWTHVGGGALETDLKSLATQLGIADQISWKGELPQPDVVRQMRLAHVFILPSRIADNGDRDGLPNVLMEAASQKLPIIATPISAIPEFLTDRQHGLLVDDTPELLAGALTELSGDHDLRRQLADAAFERLTGHFGVEIGLRCVEEKLRLMLQKAETNKS